MLFDPRKNHEKEYAWGLGIMMNNQAETLPIWQGLKQVRRMEIHLSYVIGDSIVLIRHLVLRTNPKDLILGCLLARIQNEAKGIKGVRFFHLLRALNEGADQWENLACNLTKGTLKTIIAIAVQPIP